MTPQYPHLLPVFLLEAEQCLADLAAAVARLAIAPGHEQSWRAAARAAHTLKGNAAMMGLDDIQQTAFAAELHGQSGAFRPQAGLVSQLTECLKQLRNQVDGVVTDASRKRGMTKMECA